MNKEKLISHIRELDYKDWEIRINPMPICYLTYVLGISSKEVSEIRRLRDHFEKNSLLGKIIANKYRKISPKISQRLKCSKYFKTAVEKLLVPNLFKFPQAYFSENLKEKIEKYLESLPVVTLFNFSLVLSNNLIRRKD